MSACSGCIGLISLFNHRQAGSGGSRTRLTRIRRRLAEESTMQHTQPAESRLEVGVRKCPLSSEHRIGVSAVRESYDHDQRVALDFDRVGLGLEGSYLDRVGLDAHPLGVEDRASGGQVELPAVPGAAQDLALSLEGVVAGPVRAHETGGRAKAERAGLVWAAVEDGVVPAADVEDADRTAVDFDQLAAAVGDLAETGDRKPPGAPRP